MDRHLDSLTRKVANLQQKLDNARADLIRVTGETVASNGFIELPEQNTAPGGVTNSARVYSRDNGSGKTQLVVQWPGGAVTVLATEP